MNEFSDAGTALLEVGFLNNSESRQVIFDRDEDSSSSSSILLNMNAHSWRQYVKAKTSSTERSENPDAMSSQLATLFNKAKEEIFESGVETPFSRGLLIFISKYGPAAMDTITDFVLSSSVNSEIAAEIMRWLGLMESPVCFTQRRWLLSRCLRDSSERVRDAALLGLSYLDDPWVIPYLENAIRDEQISELRYDMNQVLEQLKNTLETSQ